MLGLGLPSALDVKSRALLSLNVCTHMEEEAAKGSESLIPAKQGVRQLYKAAHSPTGRRTEGWHSAEESPGLFLVQDLRFSLPAILQKNVGRVGWVYI